MTWMEIEWDDASLDHIARHGLDRDDVEEALFDPRRILTDARSTGADRRRGVTGRTEEGRIITVIFARRVGATRIVTARDANPTERRAYTRPARREGG